MGQNRHSKSGSRKNRTMMKQFARDYLLVSMVPFFLLVLAMVGGVLIAKNYLAAHTQRSIIELSQEAKSQLQKMGESLLRTKARDVAGQVAVYLQAHPDISPAQLHSDASFSRIALQKVGRKGYTCLYEAGTGIMRVHPNGKLVNRDIRFLSPKLPSWWKIFERSLRGQEISGYYDWIEADGSLRKKYMVMTPVEPRLDGKRLMVAATAYLDEFYAPVFAVQDKAKDIKGKYHDFFSRLGMTLGGMAVLVLLLVFATVYFFGKRAAVRYILPIEKLAAAARHIGEGKWEKGVEADLRHRQDEIGALAQRLFHMKSQLQDLFGRLEARLDELKKTQEALRQSEAHYHGLFEGVPVGLYRTTPKGEIIDANATLIHMLGYPDRETFLAKNAAELYAHPSGRAAWKKEMDDCASFFCAEIKMRRYDGRVICVENYSRAVRDGDGRILYYEGSLKDVTEQVQAQEALRRSEEKYRVLYEETKRAEELHQSLLNSSADAIVIYDLKGRAQYVSPVFTRLFGWTLEEVEGRQIPFLPDSERQRTYAIIRDLIDRGKGCHGFETRRYTKDGRLMDVSISASRYDDHRGNPAGLLVVIRNITEKKMLEVQLIQAQKMEAIGTLAGGIAHDFNNLMMAILGNVSVMLYDMDESHAYYERLKNMERQIQRGSRLTNQLLGYARKGRYEVRPFDLNELIKESCEAFGRTRKEIRIHLELMQNLPFIEGDQSQIEQVLLNLCVNAADAMPAGGNLYITTSDLAHHEIAGRPFQVRPGRYVLLTLKDTGIGMHQETVERIFDPFFTTKEMGRGTGLGLASVYGIVKAHGGYIEVESEPGCGTTFRLYLPATEERPLVLVEDSGQIQKGSGTILLIDDEETVLDVGSQMLERLNYQVLKAECGQQAIETYAARQREIDLVILDMIMPDIGGGEVYDRLKEINPAVRVLLSSGYSIDSEAKEIMKRGCNGFIQKPFNMLELSRKIGEVAALPN